MTLSSATANYGLSAIATPTGTNVANDVRIGVAAASEGFSSADIGYSFRATATIAGDEVTWNMSTGSVVVTTGSPTIARGGVDDSVDFEGVTLPTLVTVNSILYTCSTATSMTRTASGGGWVPGDILQPGSELRIYTSRSVAGTVANKFTLESIGDYVEVTIIGKSS